MNIYLLERPAGQPLYDVLNGVIAASEQQARELVASPATGECGDEGPDVWLGPARCSLLGVAGGGAQPGIVLRDYNAG